MPKIQRCVCPVTVGLLLVTFLLPQSAFADSLLYGLSSSTPGQLFKINANTGAATFVANISGASGTSLVGLEYYGGFLYATDVRQNSFTFGTIDPVTGVYTAINNQSGSSNWHGLAMDHTAGLFYTIDINDNNKLKSISLSGTVTTIGSGAGIEGRGMAFDDVNKVLYATGINGLYTVNTTTGLSTFVGAMGISTGLIGLAYDDIAGILYANQSTGLNAG